LSRENNGNKKSHPICIVNNQVMTKKSFTPSLTLMNETKKAEFEKRQSHRGIKSFFSSTFNPSSHRIHTSAPSPNPNLAIFELLIKIYTLNQISYFPSPSTKREERGYSPCGKGASGEKVGVCCWQGKARKGRRLTDMFPEKQKKCASGRIYGE